MLFPSRGKLFGGTVLPNSTLFGGTPDSEKWKVSDFINAGMQVCKYASLQVCKYASMQDYKYANIQLCKCASMLVYKYANL